jgi:hypothetical protein
VVRCRSKNEYQRDMCSEEIGLCAQFVITILVFIINVILFLLIFKGGG